MANEQYNFKVGQDILAPAFNGRRSKRKIGMGKILDIVKRQSGEVMILVEQNKRRISFNLNEIQSINGEVA